jgi:hypothetical protein
MFVQWHEPTEKGKGSLIDSIPLEETLKTLVTASISNREPSAWFLTQK